MVTPGRTPTARPRRGAPGGSDQALVDATSATTLRAPLTGGRQVDVAGTPDVERTFGSEGVRVTVFDGTLLVTLGGDDPAARAVGEHHLAARLTRGTTVRAPDGATFAARRPLGFPPLLAHDDAVGDPWQAAGVARSLVATLQPPGAGTRGGPGSRPAPGMPATTRVRGARLTELAGTTPHGRWWVAQVHLLPPVTTRGLIAATPVVGSRTHLTTAGGSVALCGRTPVRAPLGPAVSTDCPACLATDDVRARLDAQLAQHASIATQVGALTAGAAARWWPRLAHLAAQPVGALGDAAVGLLHHGLPGAPDRDTALTVVADSRATVAAVARRWAEGEVRRRLLARLRVTLPGHPTRVDDELTGLLATAELLLDPATLADLLIGAFEDLGPSVALEPLTARIAAAAGPQVPERVQRWLRLQRVAAALGNGTTGTTTLLLER